VSTKRPCHDARREDFEFFVHVVHEILLRLVEQLPPVEVDNHRIGEDASDRTPARRARDPNDVANEVADALHGNR
jgi:hypothetical protein